MSYFWDSSVNDGRMGRSPPGAGARYDGGRRRGLCASRRLAGCAPSAAHPGPRRHRPYPLRETRSLPTAPYNAPRSRGRSLAATESWQSSGHRPRDGTAQLAAYGRRSLADPAAIFRAPQPALSRNGGSCGCTRSSYHRNRPVRAALASCAGGRPSVTRGVSFPGQARPSFGIGSIAIFPTAPPSSAYYHPLRR